MKRSVVQPAIVFHDDEISLRQGSHLWHRGIITSISYWDKIILSQYSDLITKSNQFNSVMPETDINYLIDEDLLEIDIFRSDKNWPDSCLEYRNHIVKLINKNSEDSIRLFIPTNSNEKDDYVRNFIGDESSKSNLFSIEITLKDSFPTPPVNVTLQDLVEFKRRRHDELVEFQNEIDRIAHTFVSCGHFKEGLRAARAQIQPCLAQLSRAMEETWSQRMFNNLKVELGISPRTLFLA